MNLLQEEVKKLQEQASVAGSSGDEVEELRKWTEIAARMATEACWEVQIRQSEVIVCR